jgi:hypothetical protein
MHYTMDLRKRGQGVIGWIGLARKARGQETTRKTKMRWVDNKMDLGERGQREFDWIGLARIRDRRALVNAAMNFRVP